MRLGETRFRLIGQMRIIILYFVAVAGGQIVMQHYLVEVISACGTR